MGPHNFQKHNIRYPRPLASASNSTSTAPSTVPSHSGSTCAWAAGPPTLFPSYYSPVLLSSCPGPELPSPSLSPHYQSSPTSFFSQRDITPTTSYEMGRLYDLSMTASLSCEAQEEDVSPLTRHPGTHTPLLELEHHHVSYSSPSLFHCIVLYVSVLLYPDLKEDHLIIIIIIIIAVLLVLPMGSIHLH